MAVTKEMLEWGLENVDAVTGVTGAPSYSAADGQAIQGDLDSLFRAGSIDDNMALRGFVGSINGQGRPDLPSFTCAQVEDAWNVRTPTPAPAPAPVPTIGTRGTRKPWYKGGRKLAKGTFKWLAPPALVLIVGFIGYDVYKRRIATEEQPTSATTQPTPQPAATTQPTAKPTTQPTAAKTEQVKAKGPPILNCENTYGVMRCKSTCATSFSGDSPPHLLASCGGRTFRSPQPMVQYPRGKVRVAMKEVQ